MGACLFINSIGTETHLLNQRIVVMISLPLTCNKYDTAAGSRVQSSVISNRILNYHCYKDSLSTQYL